MSAIKRGMVSVLRGASSVGGIVPGWFPLVVEPVFARVRGTEARVHTRFEGWEVDLDLRDYLQRKTYFRSFERRELHFVRRWLAPGDVAVDVGANVGILTLAMARAVGDSGCVVSVEPNPAAHEVLERWARTNGISAVRTINAAAGRERGEVTLGVPPADSAATSTGHYSASHRDRAITVPQVVLDDELDRLLGDPTIRLLKLDVEGMELRVLEGLGRRLEKHRIMGVLFEVNPSFPEQDALGHLLEHHGYALHSLGVGGRVGRRLRASDLTKPLPVVGGHLARNVVALAPPVG